MPVEVVVMEPPARAVRAAVRAAQEQRAGPRRQVSAVVEAVPVARERAVGVAGASRGRVGP